MPAQSPSNEAAAGAETAPLQGCVELSIGLGLCGLIVLAREPQARGVLEVQQAMDQGDQFEAQLVALDALRSAQRSGGYTCGLVVADEDDAGIGRGSSDTPDRQAAGFLARFALVDDHDPWSNLGREPSGVLTLAGQPSNGNSFEVLQEVR